MLDRVDTKMITTHPLLWTRSGAGTVKENRLAWKSIYYNILY